MNKYVKFAFFQKPPVEIQIYIKFVIVMAQFKIFIFTALKRGLKLSFNLKNPKTLIFYGIIQKDLIVKSVKNHILSLLLQMIINFF